MLPSRIANDEMANLALALGVDPRLLVGSEPGAAARKLWLASLAHFRYHSTAQIVAEVERLRDVRGLSWPELREQAALSEWFGSALEQAARGQLSRWFQFGHGELDRLAAVLGTSADELVRTCDSTTIRVASHRACVLMVAGLSSNASQSR